MDVVTLLELQERRIRYFATQRHILDTTAKLLEEVCYDVQFEPRLIPISGEEVCDAIRGNIAEHARQLGGFGHSIIALASATGEKNKKQNKAPLARAKEGPKAPTQARSTEEEAEGLRRLGRTQAPPEKKVFNKS